MPYIDKIDRHFESAINEGLSETEAEKGIANLGCFLLALVDKEILD